MYIFEYIYGWSQPPVLYLSQLIYNLHNQLKFKQLTMPRTISVEKNAQSNRLLKTQVAKQVNIDQKPPKMKGGISEKQVILSKIEYHEQDNMTESRINQAKQGLQLLKKKNSKYSKEKPAQKEDHNFAKTTYVKPQKPKENNKTQKQVQQFNQQQQPKPLKENRHNESNNNYQTNKIHKISDQEVPINSKPDFMELLERQMKKQNQLNNNYDVDGELYECSRGCGRMFNSCNLKKHQKICEKVFQSKRKVFNSSASRKTEEMMIEKKAITKTSKISTKTQISQNKVPKWKLQSAALRSGLKVIKKQQQTKEEKKMAELLKDDCIQCNFCGRKFNVHVAQRHIPFCEKKAKQLPKMNTKKK